MSWVNVDFSLVRYSPIEGTHYFYDPAFPTAIQFLLSGRWESWDVGWVKHNAQDPDIRRVAEDAEARLSRDPASGYQQWPSPPPAGHPQNSTTNGHTSPHNSADLPVQSPSDDRPTTSIPPTYPPHQAQAPPTTSLHIASPYEPLSVTTSIPTQATHVTTGTAQQSSPDSVNPSPINPSAQQHVYSPSAPPIQPAAPAPFVPSKNRETKILLSLDGDGIRGLSALLVVESLVNAICVKIGQHIDPYQIFDLMGGSSSGGLITILLGRLRMQAHRARETYKRVSREMYSNKRDFFLSLDPHAPTTNVDGSALENEIKTIIGQEVGNQEELLFDQRDDSADVFVVSTHIEIGTNKAALMRSYQTRRITGPELDANMTIWQAMRATSVAPRYMLPRAGINHRLVIEPGLVDHGTAKNNPVRDILYECRKLYRYANDMMVIVSIGTGVGFDRRQEIAEMANSVEDRSAEASVWGSKFENDHHALMERGWMKYFRFQVPLDDVPLEEWCHEEAIKERTSAYLARPEIGQMFYACVDAITVLLMGGQHQRH